jgi:HEAT repeat protein
MNLARLTASFILLIVVASVGNAADKKIPISGDEAIQLVSKPAGGFDNLSPFELQVYYRLMGLFHWTGYEFKEEHAQAWKICMLDEKRNMYARLCAAYFLLDKDKDAREFITTQIASKNLRYRYNAAEIVLLYVGDNPKKEWGVGILIHLLVDGVIDGSGETNSPPGEYPDRDRFDNMHTPIDGICISLGHMKEKDSVPALISVLERRPKTDCAVIALGEIGDKRAIPILMKYLNNRSGNEDDLVAALGHLKHKDALPILISRLGSDQSGVWGTEIILTALLEIGDKRAVEPIKEYLKKGHPKESKAVARRVLVQLNSPDPVKDLLDLLEKETYEPECSDIISALTKYKDNRVVKKLATIARTSDSGFMRREAILGLRDIGDKESLLALASLLDLVFPKDLKAEWGWKGTPDFQTEFPETILMCLKQCLKQDFGTDRTKWEKWIKNNVEPKDGGNIQ